MPTGGGIFNSKIDEIPIAVVDFETTGLTPGFDRVIEVSIVRLDPGSEPYLVLDTLVNPIRPVSATEVHGITDSDVENAPRFNEIVGDVIASLSNCVIAAYNVYFDIKFLTFELSQCGIKHTPPYFCLMYMRPMLGIGSRCRLNEACLAHDIEYEATHVAAMDARASGELLKHYLRILSERNISTYAELGNLKSYKFTEIFNNDPIPDPSLFNLSRCNRLYSRSGKVPEDHFNSTRKAFNEYYDSLKAAVADLVITDEEMAHVAQERKRLGLKKEQVRLIHARIFENAVAQFAEDEWIDDKEEEKLNRLYNCLAQLGWAPGQ